MVPLVMFGHPSSAGINRLDYANDTAYGIN